MSKLTSVSQHLISRSSSKTDNWERSAAMKFALQSDLQLLGSGYRSCVYDLGETVLKFCPHLNDGTRYFLEYAYAHPSRFVPQVREIVINEHFYLCEMEKLIENTQHDSPLNNEYPCSVSYLQLKSEKPLDPYCEIMAAVARFIPHDTERPYPDMHGQNWMFRANGDVVITDPLL